MEQSPWERGSVILSDTHFGDLENGQHASVIGLVHDAVQLALQKNLGVIFNGDTFDYYPYSSDQKRLDDSGILRESLHRLPNQGLPIAFVPGNHDPRMSHGDIQNYTLLNGDQYSLERDFFVPSSEYVVTHGHKVELFNLSRLDRHFNTILSTEFGQNWRDAPPSEELRGRILELLSGDIELQKESDRVDDYWQNTFDHPTRRKYVQWMHGIVMFLQSARGMLSSGIGRISARIDPDNDDYHIRDALEWVADRFKLNLPYRAARFAQALNIPITVCGHNHVSQLEKQVVRGRKNTSEHMYVNGGSAYQKGQPNTLVVVERGEEETRVELLEHQSEESAFKLLKRGLYHRSKELLTV